MERSTIDFGIDLGTTNSEIAVLIGTKPEIIKTNEGADYTPSAVAFDRKGRQIEGEVAKNKSISLDETERSDVRLKFKLQMGHPDPVEAFKVNGKQMTPEELSAVILKKLRADVQRKDGEEIPAAAISIPAVFKLPECSATDRAAKLAGLSFSPLIQEPVAAALAYGFQTTKDRVFWMVYDFGGGTFDAAIMQVRDEQIQVVNHGGDRDLGGGLIDLEIAKQLLVPMVAKEFNLLPDDRRWKHVLPLLTYYAEKAKVSLSEKNEADIEIMNLFLVKDGASTPFECELKRSDIERLTEPFIERSINLCKVVLEEARLSSSDIEKLILVGGPTKMPLFREMLDQKLGISLELRVDPLTVVARGAAIFAGTQIIPEVSRRLVPLSTEQFKLELDYQPIGDEAEPSIGGRVTAPGGQSLQGYTIELVEEKTPWRSGKIDVGASGAFVSTVHAERDRRNEFLIELRDASGNRCETVPDRFPYTIGITISAQPIVNNIGIALANGEVATFFEKGHKLPNRHTELHLYTTSAIKSGNSGTLLRIPVIEGNNARADRNELVGYLEVSGQNLQRDVPIGSPIEVTITLDESRKLRVIAYVPILDEEFKEDFDSMYPKINERDLTDQVEKAKARLEEIRNNNQQIGSKSAADLLQQIENEQLVSEIDATANSVKQNDKEALNRLQRRRIVLDVKLDDIEKLIAWPTLVLEAETTLSNGREIVTKYGDSQDNIDFSLLEEALEKAIASKNPDILQQKIRSLSQLVFEVLMKQPGFWVAQLERLANEQKVNMRDQTEAELLIAQGYQAVNNNDVESLQLAVRKLYGLLPDSIAEDLRGYKSTIMKE
ncbi:Hsp70 family protein [Chloroflexota bacterium]